MLFDGGEHELDERGGLACVVAGIDGIVVFLLMVVDDGLDRQPCKYETDCKQKYKPYNGDKV